MPILNIQPNNPGQSGVVPNLVYIQTNDTLATVTASGYLNGAVKEGMPISDTTMAFVSTKATPNATASDAALLEVKYSAGNWSLVPTVSPGLVDPGSCTITAAAGASNTATVTIQLKDGAGTNIARSVAFKVYSSSTSDGLTLQSAASTGYSVASGGLSLANGSAVTTQITAMSSASGACVLSLLDTGKQTSYLVLALPSGNKISAQLSSGSYGA